MIKKLFRTNSIVAFFLWTLAALVLLMSEEYMTDAFYALAFVSLIGGVIAFNSSKLFVVRFVEASNKKQLIWMPFFSVLFLLMLSWHRMFSNPLWEVYLGLGLVRRLFVYVFLFILVPMGVVISMCEILDKLTWHFNVKSRVSASDINSCSYIIPFIVLTVISFAFILAAYPGLSEPDGWGLWNWVHNGVYDEWHTIGYLLFVKLCSLIYDSLFTVEMANVFLYLIVNLWAFRIVAQVLSSKVVWRYLMAILLSFSPLLYLQGMNKDTLFNIALFGCCVGVYLILYAENIRKRDLIFSACFFLGAAIFRHAGFFVIEIALLALLIFLVVNKRIDRVKCTCFVMMTTAIGYFLVVVVLGRWAFNANPNPPYVKYSVPMYMMGAMASDDEVVLSDELVETYELFAPVETWREAHTRYYADPVSREWGPVLSYPTKVPESVYGPAIIKANLGFLVKYPGKYLSNYLDMTSILWEITRPQDGMEVALVPSMVGSERYYSDTESVKANGFSKLIREYSEFAAGIPVYRSMVWRGGFAFFVYILLIFLAFKKRRGQIVFVIVPYMLYYLSLFLSIPAQATRYVVGAVEILPFFVTVFYARCVHDESV